MDGNIIAYGIQLFIGLHHRDVTGHVQGMLHRQIWITSIYIHTETVRRICHLYANGSQTDDPKLLSFDLSPGKSLFRLLSRLCYTSVAFVLLAPLDTARNVTGSQQHRSDHKLLYPIGIGSRRIEYDDSLIGTFFQRDIVDTRTRPGDGKQMLWQIHIMHDGTPYQNRLRLRHSICHLIIICQHIQTACGDRI